MEKVLPSISEIEKALDEIRPHLNSDGGDIEVVDITDDLVVRVLWKGNCQACRFSEMTMKGGVESVIKSKFPVIQGVEAINETVVDEAQ